MNTDASLFPTNEPESSDAPKFEDALADLERVVRTLEAGETGLEESIREYEKGVGLLKHCFGQLRRVEMRILELTGVDASGQPTTRAFEHVASAEVKAEKKPSARRRETAG